MSVDFSARAEAANVKFGLRNPSFQKGISGSYLIPSLWRCRRTAADRQPSRRPTRDMNANTIDSIVNWSRKAARKLLAATGANFVIGLRDEEPHGERC